MAGAYVYDNTLIGVKMKDFLEWPAKCFKQVSTPGSFRPGTVAGNGPAHNTDPGNAGLLTCAKAS